MGRKQINKYDGKTHRCKRFYQCFREYQRELSLDRTHVVAVECLCCKTIIPTNTLMKQFCPDCRRIMYQTIPQEIKLQLANQPSFRRYPPMLLRWKQVIDYKKYKRDNNIKKMSMETRLRR